MSEIYVVINSELGRDAFCRICEVVIECNKDWMVSWYSSANRGMYIHICPDCVKNIYELVPK